MRSIQTRLEKLEGSFNASGRIAIVFVRPAHKENDLAKQKEEYFTRWGNRNSPTFLVLTEYCESYDDYEIFIKAKRESCPEGNCYTDWWERKCI